MNKNTTTNSKDFTMVFSVAKTPKEAFDAITNVRGWWSAKLVGNSKKQGDEFEFRYEDIHYSKQKLVEVVPDKKIVWLVTESQINFVKHDKSEWTGTKVIFEITEKGKKTEVRFTHEGLVPEIECFKECSAGWSHYLKQSLQKLLTTGKGQPD